MTTPTVDSELCIGCGVCEEICPRVFEVVDEKSIVIGPENCDSCDCDEAVVSCPVDAIELIEKE